MWPPIHRSQGGRPCVSEHLASSSMFRVSCLYDAPTRWEEVAPRRAVLLRGSPLSHMVSFLLWLTSSLMTLLFVCAKSLQPCPTLSDSVDCSPPGSSVQGILQARILEWVAVPSSRGIFLTQGWNLCLLHLLHWRGGSLLLMSPGMDVLLHRYIFSFLKTAVVLGEGSSFNQM